MKAIRLRRSVDVQLSALISLILVLAVPWNSTNAQSAKKVLWDNAHDPNHSTSTYSMFRGELGSHGYIVDIKGDKFTSSLLANYDLVITVEPDLAFSSEEIQAIVQFVENGGGLWVMGGWYPRWSGQDNANAFLSQLGITLNKDAIMGSRYMGLQAHAISQGVTSILLWDFDSLTLSGTATAVGIESGRVILAANKFGCGRVVVIGDEIVVKDKYDWLYKADNLTFGLNVVEWLTSTFPTLPEEAELAIDVIGAPYLGDGVTWGGKGFNCCACPPKRFVDPDEIKTWGYCYYDGRINKCNANKETGLDCSGLIYWAYNRAYYGDQVLTWQDLKNRPLLWEGVSGQRDNNTDPIPKDDLEPGDLIFFKKHVAMWIGPFCHQGNEYNVVHASGFTGTITPANYDVDTEELLTISSTGKPQILKPLDYRRVSQPRKKAKFTVQSPVDLVVKDPDGLIIKRETREVPGMEYQVYDINGDGELDDIVVLGEIKIGDYLISVVLEGNAVGNDTYSLEVTTDGVVVSLAENVPIKNIPAEPYIVRSTQTEIIPIIPAKIDFDPDTLNLKGEGKWVTVYIELPTGHGYDVSDINLGRTFLEGLLEVQHSDVQDGVLMVKFDRQDLIIFLESIVGVIPPDDIPLTVIGGLNDGRQFEGSETIRVID